MQEMVKTLRVVLGPGTADLNLRIGLNSGPVTGGVLRGERARFQLFGDTLNTTARIESTGVPGRIHMLSEETANCLIKAGRSHWVDRREEKVTANGKGVIQTYWLVDHRDSEHDASSQQDTATTNADHSEEMEDDSTALSLVMNDRMLRMVDYGRTLKFCSKPRD